MNLSFYGAAKEVTGSCYCLEANGKKLSAVAPGYKEIYDLSNGELITSGS